MGHGIICFKGYTGGKKEMGNIGTEIKWIVDKLEAEPAGNYTIRDAERLADDVLSSGGWDKPGYPVPITGITECFGFKTYRESGIPDGASGNIYVGGNTADMYGGDDKVIIAGSSEEWRHQRFIIAHELGHYLMDYLGNPAYSEPGKLFARAYTKQNHGMGDIKEDRADRFAAELLMPFRLFMQQYARAMWDSRCNETYILTYLSKYFDVKESSVVKRIAEVMEA